MSSAFDSASLTYDKDFTNTEVGKMQREQVWKYVEQYLKDRRNLKILELNCGTGADAARFASQGHSIIATDISPMMLDAAKKTHPDKEIDFQLLNINELDSSNAIDKDFDLIFSNFGGLNCLDNNELEALPNQLHNHLKADGRFIAVIMPKMCLWEVFYFILKGQMKNAFRRKREFAIANVSGTQVKTWYYSPHEFSSIMGNQFVEEETRPIGLFVPPSYLDHFFTKWPLALKFLSTLERKISKFSWQAPFSDHFFIQLKTK